MVRQFFYVCFGLKADIRRDSTQGRLCPYLSFAIRSQSCRSDSFLFALQGRSMLFLGAICKVGGYRMGITLSGSCHCKSVTFTVKSSEPMPFNRCYCTVCRKTAGAGGFAINIGNIGADFKTLEIEGRKHIRVYRARISAHYLDSITAGTMAGWRVKQFIGFESWFPTEF